MHNPELLTNMSSGAAGSVAVHGEGPCTLCSSWFILYAVLFHSVRLILNMKNIVKVDPFNLFTHFFFYCQSASIFKPLAFYVLTAAVSRICDLLYFSDLLPVVAWPLSCQAQQNALEKSKLQITIPTQQCS